MAKPILIANWKNKPESLREAGVILTGLRKKSAIFKKIKTFIAPPEVYYESVSKRVNGLASLASQGLPMVQKGTHTGQPSLEILRNFGVRLAILGHSEERALGETSEQVAKKIKIALKVGITPLVCVGENERDVDGNHLEFIRQEIEASLEGLKRKDVDKIIIAYEPVWAIGKKAKNAVHPEDLAQMALFIRRVLTDIFGRKNVEKTPILYGGSVESSNVHELYREGGVDGFLVGHASLNPEEFAEIAKELTIKKQPRRPL